MSWVSMYSSWKASDTFNTYVCFSYHWFGHWWHSGTTPYLMVWCTPSFLTRKLVLHVRETLNNERSTLRNLWLILCLLECYSWNTISKIEVNQWGNVTETNFQRFKLYHQSDVINIVNIISSFTEKAVQYLTVFWHHKFSLAFYSAINVLGYT